MCGKKWEGRSKGDILWWSEEVMEAVLREKEAHEAMCQNSTEENKRRYERGVRGGMKEVCGKKWEGRSKGDILWWSEEVMEAVLREKEAHEAMCQNSGEGRSKGDILWWSEEVMEAVLREKEAHEAMCQNSTEENKRRSERGVWEEVGG